MTVLSNSPRVVLACNGVTVDFPFPYLVLGSADLTVIETNTATQIGVEKLLTTDFTILETPDPNTGGYPSGVTVHALAAPANGKTWTIINDPDPTQLVNLTNGGSLPVEAQIEVPLDRLTIIVQRVLDKINRTLRQPDADAVQILALPNAVDRASKFAAYDASGNPIAAAGTSANLGPVSGFVNTFLDDADPATAQATLQVPSQSSFDALSLIVTSVKQSVLSPIMNGSMELWQRGTTFPAAGAGIYCADRFKYNQQITGAVVTLNRSTNIPSFAQAGVQLNYSVEVDVTTADAAVGATDLVYLQSVIEGYNWRPFAQRGFTVSFWALSSKTGVHCATFQNNPTAVDRFYIAEYTINVANTWEFKTVVIPASPSAGNWNYTNGGGLQIFWVLMAGANFQAAAGAWTFGSSLASANQVNVMDNTANFFRIAGVKLELGSIATPLQNVPFEDELRRVKRYYQKSFNYATAPVQNAGFLTGESKWYSTVAGATATTVYAELPVNLRNTTPTITVFNPEAANAQLRNRTDAADFTGTAAVQDGDHRIGITGTGNAGLAIGESIIAHWTVDDDF